MTSVQLHSTSGRDIYFRPLRFDLDIPCLPRSSDDERVTRLNARALLLNRALVAPIALDYPIKLDKGTADRLYFTDHLNGTAGPMIGLAFRDRAYLGWLAEMIKSADQPGKMEMGSWAVMIDRLHGMYEEGRPGHVVFFEKVLQWVVCAHDAAEHDRRGLIEAANDLVEK